MLVDMTLSWSDAAIIAELAAGLHLMPTEITLHESTPLRFQITLPNGSDPEALVGRTLDKGSYRVLTAQALPEIEVGAGPPRGPNTSLVGVPLEVNMVVEEGLDRNNPAAQSLRRDLAIARDDQESATERIAAVYAALNARRSDLPLIVGLTGMGGVGKTALAEHIAYQLREGFPTQLWVDVGASVGPALSPVAILRQLFRALAPSYPLPQDTELANAVTTWWATRKALIVLDDISEESQIPPIPTGVGIIITSRERLLLAGETVISVQPLPLSAAAQLARHHHSPLTEEQAIRVAMLCGGVPQAIIAVTQAFHTNLWSVAKKLQRWTAQPSMLLLDLRQSAAITGGSEDLTDNLTNAFANINPAALRYLAGVITSISMEVLDELYRVHLIEWDHATQQATINPLIRAAAQLSITI